MVADGLTPQQRATLDALSSGAPVAHLLIYRDGTTGLLNTVDRGKVIDAVQRFRAYAVPLGPLLGSPNPETLATQVASPRNHF